MGQRDRPALRLQVPAGLAGRPPRLHVLMVTPAVPLRAVPGSPADVALRLSEALDRLGHRVTLLAPACAGLSLDETTATPAVVTVGPSTHAITFHVRSSSASGRLVMIEAAAGDPDDDPVRLAILCHAALEFARIDRDVRPVDIVHGHDWQTGLLPALLRTDPGRYPHLAGAGLVFTVHDVKRQGLFAPDVVPALGLPWSACTVETGEFWGRFAFLKSGITCADRVTTVGPTYAAETCRPAGGSGMEGVLAACGTSYSGILNGIDTAAWDPSTDVALPATYDAGNPVAKAECKRALLEQLGLAIGDDARARPLVAVVGRHGDEVGGGLIERSAGRLAGFDASWVFVGEMPAAHERFLRALASRYPSRMAVRGGDEFERLVMAGADVLLVPSSAPPGDVLTQQALRYGTVPVVLGAGGPNDVVQPYTARAQGANGFKFRPAAPEALARALRQALGLYRNRDVWAQLVQRGMAADHSWETAAREYVKVYRRAHLQAAVRAAG